MGPALRRVDVIDEAVYIFCVGVVVLHGNLHQHAVPLALAVKHLLIQGHIAAV